VAYQLHTISWAKGVAISTFKDTFLGLPLKSNSAIASTALQNENNGNMREYDHENLKVLYRRKKSASEHKEDEDLFDKRVGSDERLRFIEGALGEAYAKSKNISVEQAVAEIKEKIMQGNPKAHGATKVSSDAATARLTDVKGYTGAHKERFDLETGKGKGIEGREYLMDQNAAAGYVSGYKGKDTYDQNK
ncbi:p25-alpha, partial [Opisthorchis viverrini]